MGISGLLPLLKSIHKQSHLRDFNSQTLGVDAYGWLHRGATTCALDLALDNPTTRYIDYFLSRVRMLQHFGVTPYLVFDGGYLPSKSTTEVQRAEKREKAKQRGLELLKLGRKKEALTELQKSIDVTTEMAAAVIRACEKLGVRCVVAPYEADAQLYYLEKIGEIDGVISEDSDMLVFGVRTLITKLDQYGECVVIEREKFTSCKEVSFVGWSDTEFRHMCILSGCDYLDNIPGLGLKTAHRLMRQHKKIEKILRVLQFDGNWTVPKGYLKAFMRADLTFRHQRVYDPRQGKLVMANEPEGELDDEVLVHIGPDLEEDVAQRVARGELCPITMQEIVVKEPTRGRSIHQSPHWRPPKLAASQSVPPPKNKTITSFFKPKAEEKKSSVPATPARPPLSAKSGNTPELRRMQSAPSKAVTQKSPTGSKRSLPWTTPTGIKKPRTTTEDDDPAKGTQSEYFTVPKMRRVRPPPKQVPQPQFDKENIPPVRTTGNQSSAGEAAAPAKPDTPRSPPASSPITLPPATTPAEPEDDFSSSPFEKLSTSTPVTQTPTPASSFSSTDTPTPSIRKVAQGWKEKYTFNSSRASTQLETIIKKTSTSTTMTAPRLTPLQKMRASAAMSQESPTPSPPVDFWPDFVGTQGRPRSVRPSPVAAGGGGKDTKSRDRSVGAGGGLFAQFGYKK